MVITETKMAHTSGACRSANRIGRMLGLKLDSVSLDFMAELIDEETAAPDMLQALRDAKTLIEALMPGVKHIALQDYQALNETPMKIDALIAKAAESA